MLTLLLVVLILGVVWTLIPYLKLDEPFPQILRIILVVCLIYALLGVIGFVPFPVARL